MRMAFVWSRFRCPADEGQAFTAAKPMHENQTHWEPVIDQQSCALRLRMAALAR
jgi:hypothetical protein